MTYFFSATLALALFVFVGWQRRRTHTRAASAGLFVNVTAVSTDFIPEQSPAVVAAGVGLALKRLTPVLNRRGIRADVAVHPDLLVGLSGDALADLLEQLFAAAIHHPQAGRMVVTAASDGGQVSISVTDDTAGADPDARAGSVRALAERATLRGGTLEITIRRAQGTTMTLRLAAAPGHPGATADKTDDEPLQGVTAPRAVCAAPMAANQGIAGLAGAA